MEIRFALHYIFSFKCHMYAQAYVIEYTLSPFICALVRVCIYIYTHAYTNTHLRSRYLISVHVTHLFNTEHMVLFENRLRKN